MAIRLEWIVVAAIVVISALSYFVKFSSQSGGGVHATRELEFHDTTFLEVDQNGILGDAYARVGIREKGVLHMRHLDYRTDAIRLLHADSGTFEAVKIYLDGNVTVDEKSGLHYRTENIVYNKQTKILHVTSPFEATLAKNSFKGNELIYDTRRKEVTASMVEAVLFPVETEEAQ